MTYWDELEYDIDEYYDPILHDPQKPTAGQKRKRLSGHQSAHKSKRRKNPDGRVDMAANPQESLIFWRSEIDDSEVEFPLHKHCQVHSVFPDWETRFSIDKAWTATGEVEDGGDSPSHTANAQQMSIDDAAPNEPPMLALLRAKLTGMGLGAVQQAALVEQLMDLLSSGEADNLEELLDQLTDNLLTEVSENDEGQSAQWLTQQGVDLNADEGQANTAMAIDKSPGDSAIEVETGNAHVAQRTPTRASRKTGDPITSANAVELGIDEHSMNGIDAPAGPVVESLTNGAIPQDQGTTRGSPILAAGKTTLSRNSSATKPAQVPASHPPMRKTSKQPDKSKPEVAESTVPGTTASHPPARKQTDRSKLEAAEFTVPNTTTRKRKATAEPETETAPKAATGKRQQRNFAAPTASSSKRTEGTATRDTRSSARKK